MTTTSVPSLPATRTGPRTRRTGTRLARRAVVVLIGLGAAAGVAGPLAGSASALPAPARGPLLCDLDANGHPHCPLKHVDESVQATELAPADATPASPPADPTPPATGAPTVTVPTGTGHTSGTGTGTGGHHATDGHRSAVVGTGSVPVAQQAPAPQVTKVSADQVNGLLAAVNGTEGAGSGSGNGPDVAGMVAVGAVVLVAAVVVVARRRRTT